MGWGLSLIDAINGFGEWHQVPHAWPSVG